MWTKPDPKSPQPISSQIRGVLIAAISAGRLRVGERLPSVRGLATELLVNPNTVAKVYRELERDGFVNSRPGSGVDVSQAAQKLARVELAAEIDEAVRKLVDRSLESGLDGSQVLALVESRLVELEALPTSESPS